MIVPELGWRTHSTVVCRSGAPHFQYYPRHEERRSDCDNFGFI